MSVPAPPSNVLPYLQKASSGTGIPLSVVEAQNLTESDYGANDGPSSAGARGPWQFEPGTYTGLGFNLSTINDWGTSTNAYIKLMNQYLKQYKGNLFQALEAYNAGPGNLSAGSQYASSILSKAGVSQNAVSGTPSQQAEVTGINVLPNVGSDPFGLSGIVNGIGQGFFNAIGVPSLKDLLQRLGLILLGVALVIVGITVLVKSSNVKVPDAVKSAGKASAAEAVAILCLHTLIPWEAGQAQVA